MTGEFKLPQDEKELHELFLALWSKAQDGPKYEKGQWMSFQVVLWGLLGWTPPEINLKRPWPTPSRNGEGEITPHELPDHA